ncbi:MAG: HupE/UreJ family protein [Pseudomonadota bacterium]
MTRWFIALLFGLVTAGSAAAHEVRPAYLQVTEEAPGTYIFVLRRPLDKAELADARPIIPGICTLRDTVLVSNSGQFRSERWRVDCSAPLVGLDFSGLSGTQNEVLLNVTLLNAKPMNFMLRSGNPVARFDEPASGSTGYFVIGVEHLVFGIDHVLFVICLFLFVRTPMRLLQTITAFTVAHSVTLGMSVLELFSLPQGPVEAVIAVSILFLCRELLLPEHRRSRLTENAPWLMAFGFGLLHGFGFAGALSDIGIPQGQLLSSLFLFNLGVEAGQLLIVALLAFIGYFARALLDQKVVLLERALISVVGCYAALWTIERTVHMV